MSAEQSPAPKASSPVPSRTDDDGARLDRWFKRHYPGVSHIQLEKLLRKGEVRLDGKRAKASDRVAAGQMLRLPPQVTNAPPPRAARHMNPTCRITTRISSSPL